MTTSLRNRSIVRLRAEGVEFAENFLGDKLQRAADRFVLAQMMRELREMTIQPRQFF